MFPLSQAVAITVACLSWYTVVCMAYLCIAYMYRCSHCLHLHLERNTPMPPLASYTNNYSDRIQFELRLVLLYTFAKNLYNPILVTAFPEWLNGTEKWSRTSGAVRPSSSCLWCVLRAHVQFCWFDKANAQ